MKKKPTEIVVSASLILDGYMHQKAILEKKLNSFDTRYDRNYVRNEADKARRELSRKRIDSKLSMEKLKEEFHDAANSYNGFTLDGSRMDRNLRDLLTSPIRFTKDDYLMLAKKYHADDGKNTNARMIRDRAAADGIIVHSMRDPAEMEEQFNAFADTLTKAMDSELFGESTINASTLAVLRESITNAVSFVGTDEIFVTSSVEEEVAHDLSEKRKADFAGEQFKEGFLHDDEKQDYSAFSGLFSERLSELTKDEQKTIKDSLSAVMDSATLSGKSLTAEQVKTYSDMIRRSGNTEAAEKTAKLATLMLPDSQAFAKEGTDIIPDMGIHRAHLAELELRSGEEKHRANVLAKTEKQIKTLERAQQILRDAQEKGNSEE